VTKRQNTGGRVFGAGRVMRERECSGGCVKAARGVEYKRIRAKGYIEAGSVEIERKRPNGSVVVAGYIP